MAFWFVPLRARWLSAFADREAQTRRPTCSRNVGSRELSPESCLPRECGEVARRESRRNRLGQGLRAQTPARLDQRPVQPQPYRSWRRRTSWKLMFFRLVVKVWITKTRATEIRFAHCHSQGAFGETTLDRFNSLRIDREVESYFRSCSGLFPALLCSFLLGGLF